MKNEDKSKGGKRKGGKKKGGKRKGKTVKKSDRLQRENQVLAEAREMRNREHALIVEDCNFVLREFMESIHGFEHHDGSDTGVVNGLTLFATFVKMHPNEKAEAKWLLNNYNKFRQMSRDQLFDTFRNKLIPLSLDESNDLGDYLEPFIYRIQTSKGLYFFLRHIIDHSYFDEELHRDYIATDDTPDKRAIVDEIITMFKTVFGFSDQVYISPKDHDEHARSIKESHQFCRILAGITNNYIDAVIPIFAFRKWFKLVQAGLPSAQIILRTYYTKPQLETLRKEFLNTFYTYSDDDDSYSDGSDVDNDGSHHDNDAPISGMNN